MTLVAERPADGFWIEGDDILGLGVCWLLDFGLTGALLLILD
jgi:hypothetical protein